VTAALTTFFALPILMTAAWLGTWARFGRIPQRFWLLAVLAVLAGLPLTPVVDKLYQHFRSSPPATVLDGFDSPAALVLINFATGAIALVVLLCATGLAELMKRASLR
jgi:hypothetical protein